jgi:tetratricopeptide (TPR) repeat protein
MAKHCAKQTQAKLKPQWLMLILSCAVLSGLSYGQGGSGFEDITIPQIRAPLCFGMSGVAEPQALEICDALYLKQTVKARELAQQWLVEEPDSPAAQFAFSEVLFTVEGNMARALFHLNRAEELTDYTSLDDAIESGNLQWHYLTLSQLSYVHQLMGDQVKSLAYLDLISQIYGQDVESFRGWPLIKLKDFEAARESANKVLAATDDERARSRAWNTLCAVELASLSPIASTNACDLAISEDDSADSSNETDTVYLSNAAEVSLSLLQIDKAESYLDRATRYLDPDSVADPWIYKLYLTMNQGRFDEARTALDRMLVWRNQQEPIISAMNRAEHFLVSANFLLLAGYAEDSIKLSMTALNQPDRNGSYSADDSQKDSYAALVNMMANRTQYQIELERISTLGWLESTRARIDSLSLLLDAWRAERRAASLFAEFDTLQNRLRPYAPLEVHIPEWVEPEIIRVMGTGVMSTILDQALANGAFQLNEGYYYAYKTEIFALDSDYARAIDAGAQALRLLPAQEVLLKARILTRMADASWALDDFDNGAQFYELAYRQDPSIIRRLGTAVPVQVVADNTEIAKEIASLLEKSPRFRAIDAGLRIEISAAPDVSICINTSSGVSLSCYTEASTESLASQRTAQEFTQRFHTKAFGLGYDISKAQRSILLGSSVILSSQNDVNLQRNRNTVMDRK